jgi:ABC-type multidrug transport system ATPase subunit
MDEPTTGLDVKSKHWLLKFLEERDCCIVFTTHSFQEAEFCDRYLVLSEGKMEYFGTDLKAARGVLNVPGSDQERPAI